MNLLGQLHIKNIGIIDDITINFEDGFNVMTGETGAGKSLIVGSIAAVTGSRISKEMLKTGAESAFIEAYFFEKDKDIILSREIFTNGRNICKIDGKMATLAQLKEIGEAVIDIHGQHDNQSLLIPSMHLELLDKFIGEEINERKSQYTKLLEEYHSIQKELKEHYGDEKERTRKIDLLKYQIEEIKQAKLKQGEEEELKVRRNFMMNAEKITKTLSNTYYNLNDIVVDNLGMAVHELSNIADLDETYDKILLNLNEAYYMLKDCASETLDSMNAVEFDENEQNTIEERLDMIYQLKRKYGQDIDSILKYAEKMTQELNNLENADEMIDNLKQKLKELEKQLTNIALQMRHIRKEKANVICREVNKELQELEMKNAIIEFEFKELEDFAEMGMDEVQILITTNLGEAAKPLQKIASGGEISRIMLALKNVFASVDAIPCMIFDEIDTGISGQAAKVVAEKMNTISQNHQLICITHLPIIAAYGKTNYFISKVVENEKTHTQVQKLSEEETINEVARMLDGNNLTKTSLKHAKELVKLRIK